MPIYDVNLTINLTGEGGNAHAVGMMIEEALESEAGQDAARQFKSAFVMFITQSDATYDGVLLFCEQWADVTYLR